MICTHMLIPLLLTLILVLSIIVYSAFSHLNVSSSRKAKCSMSYQSPKYLVTFKFGYVATFAQASHATYAIIKLKTTAIFNIIKFFFVYLFSKQICMQILFEYLFKRKKTTTKINSIYKSKTCAFFSFLKKR